MINRMVRVLKNDLTLWPELKEDPEASSQGYLVILLIAGISAVTSAMFTESLVDLVVFIMITFIGTLVAYVSVLILAYVLGRAGNADGTFHQLRTALAYGYSPSILSSIPFIGWIFGLWVLVTISSAIRETMGIGKGLTFFIVVLSMVINIAVVFVMVGALVAMFI